MRYLFTIFTLAFFCIFTTNAQQTVTKIDAKTMASLYFVYGWHKNPNDDKWTTKEKEIKGVDSFKSYSISSYTLKSKNYIGIIKLEEEGSLHVYNIYSIDYKEYQDKITKWEEKTVLRFPIIKHLPHNIKLDS